MHTKKNGKKLLMIFTLMFALLTSFVSNFVVGAVPVSAALTEQSYVTIDDIYRDDNVVVFTTMTTKIKSLTYQIVYPLNGVNHADLVTEENITEVSPNKYSFEITTDKDVVGIKIWKIKYLESENYYKNKMTTGSNSIGDTNAVYKKNYVEVTADLLDVFGGCDEGSLLEQHCEKYYTFYFNLDTVIDSIVDLSLEYSIKTYKSSMWGLSSSTSSQSFETKINHTEDVLDYESAYAYFSNWVSNNLSNEDDLLKAEDVWNYSVYMHRRPALGANEKDNGYSWYVQPLLDLELEDSNSFLDYSEVKQELQEVAIVKMSYYAEGEYYEDIPVLDEDTGEAIIDTDNSSGNDVVDSIKKVAEWLKNTWRKIKTFFVDTLKIGSWWIWLVIGLAVLIFVRLLNVILSLVGLDKESRLIRSNRRLAALEMKYNKVRMQEERELLRRQKRDKKLRKNESKRNSKNFYNH